MKLLTPEKFHERHAELVEMREKADADYRRANLEAAMGTGTDADVLTAKQALDLVVGQLEGLEAARVESDRIRAAEVRQARQEAYNKLSEDTESLLAQREATIARIEKIARTLGNEMAEYDALTSQLRSAVTAYRPHYKPVNMPAHVASNQMQGAFESLARTEMLLPLVTAAISNDARVLQGITLADREQGETKNVLRCVGRIAPERELA
ncbi:hypothetical protein [Novosphingobium sp. 9U]|uniref:hypothetical protein n=1 Tax=Novosphingobium sp. 9U TaxID=2653158 RepID=UPI0012F0FE1B|nr:hypothetical protein [Novosphingobium sp. 9U]VWX52963.1 hypothetical protein NOVOSPHI9U_420206 [Novosphingobium sp. 9U]